MFKIFQKRKSHYYKILINSFAILLIPVLVIGLIYIQAHGIIKKQIVLASQNTLNQFFLRMDDMVSESRNICISLVGSKELKNYATYADMQSKKTVYQEVIIKNLISGYLSERYSDIFVYYTNEDRIISGRNSPNDLKDYYEIYYDGEENDFLEEFREIAECVSKKPLLCSMNGNSEDAYLCVAMKNHTYNSERQNYVVVVVLNPTYVQKVLHEAENLEQNGISMILSMDNEMILATEDINQEYFSGEMLKDDATFSNKIGNKDYIVQVKKSDVVSAYYAYAVSEKYFWSILYELYILCGVGIIVIAVVGMLFVFRQSKKVFQPIGQMVINLQQKSNLPYDQNYNTEFEFVEDFFEKEAEEKRILRRTMWKGEVARRNNFIFEMLIGNVKLSEKGSDVFHENGIDLCSDYFYVLLCQVEQDGVLENEMLFFVFANVFEELFNKDDRGYVVPVQTNRYAILVNSKAEHDKSDLIEVLKIGNNFLREKMEIVATWGISSCHQGLSGVSIAYEEANVALRYRYLLGKECMIDYEELESREFKYPSTSELRMPSMISDYVSGKDEKTSVELVEEIFQLYDINHNASIETIECFKFEVASVLHRFMMQSGYIDQERRSTIKELINLSTLKEFRRKIEQILNQLYQKNRKDTEEKDVCAKAMNYIVENYANEQLNLNFLGELTGMTPSYLSKLFKEKYNVTIPDCISQTRIQHAKQQLKDTNMSIQNIAEQNGFLDSNSFIRTFKRQEGITPGVYRSFFEEKKD